MSEILRAAESLLYIAREVLRAVNDGDEQSARDILGDELLTSVVKRAKDLEAEEHFRDRETPVERPSNRP